MQHKARKRFGQNFLHDQSIIERIVDVCYPKNTDHFVEIGPGHGAITEFILSICRQLDVVELDRNLVPILQDKFGSNKKFRLHQGDALKFDFEKVIANEQPFRLVGNLPYNISMPLLFYILTFKHRIQDMHFMLQKEVVQRLSSQVNSKHYGRLGIMAQYHCQVIPLFEVPPESFHPIPKVDSMIVKLVPYKELPWKVKDEGTLKYIVSQAFQFKRKTLANNLKNDFDRAQLMNLNIDPDIRAQELSIQSFITLSDNLFHRMNV